MSINLGAALSGEYKICITKPDGTTTDSGWFPNLILNAGLDMLGAIAGPGPTVFASIGTGTSTPAVTQTSLDTLVAYSGIGTSVSITNAGSPTYATMQTRAYAFPQGSVIGNMTEVGIGNANTPYALFSRALILDALGAPTTITLIAIDQLTIYYRLTISPPVVDATGSIVINGVTYNYTSRMFGISSFASIEYIITGATFFSQLYSVTTYGTGAILGTIDSTGITGAAATLNSYQGAADAAPTIITSAYTHGNYYVDWNLHFSPTQANPSLCGMHLTGFGPWRAIQFQIVFDKPIPKTNTTVLSLTFRFSWGR